MNCSLPGSSAHGPWDFPGKSAGVGYHFLQVNIKHYQYSGLPRWWQVVKNPLADAGGKKTQVQSLGQEDPLEGSIAWRTPWTEEPGGLQSIRSQRVRQDLNDLACMHYQHGTTSLIL